MSKPEWNKNSAEEFSQAWNKISNIEKETPKWLPKGRIVQISPNVEPEQTKVDGKYGERLLYIVDSSIGRIYITPVQIIDVCKRFAMQTPPFSQVVEFP